LEVVALLRTRDAVTGVLGGLWEMFWEIALGVVVLWLFFLVMGAVSAGDPVWLTIAMAVLAIAAIAHYVHMRRMVESDTELSRRAHAMRERRGF
jgi:membrane protein implicated in regulation of membrane protease activity